MDPTSNHPLLIVTKEDVIRIRSVMGMDDMSKVRESVDAVKEWSQKQQHFVVKNLDERIIERLLALSNGSIEGTKHKLDQMLTSRGLVAEITLHKNVDEFDRLLEIINYAPLPKLCPLDQSRIMVSQFTSEKLDDFTLLGYFRYAYLIGEYRLFKDYTFNERYIIDLKNVSLPLISKINPIIMTKAELMSTKGYGTKIKGIHVMNAPNFVDKILFLIKQAVSAKVASRIHIHKTYEDLHKHIPKEIIPKDYNGDEQPMSKLTAQWRDELKTPAALKYLNILNTLVTDETLRVGGTFNEEIMGIPGSFRKLNVD